MSEERPVAPVKLLIAALCSSRRALELAIERLQALRGAIDHQGPPRPFDLTHYYEEEMGNSLQRSILSFDKLFCAGELAAFKHQCVELERSLGDGGGRKANLDAGYLDHGKLVLASLKPAGQKIYLARGVYADLVARYKEGRYQPFEWTFPDFSAGVYDRELGEIRRRYLEQLRS